MKHTIIYLKSYSSIYIFFYISFGLHLFTLAAFRGSLDYLGQRNEHKRGYQSSLKGIIAAMHKKAAAAAAVATSASGVANSPAVPEVRKIPLLAPRLVTMPADDSSCTSSCSSGEQLLSTASLSKTQIVNPFLKSSSTPR